MLQKLNEWSTRYNNEIAWFVIGMLTQSAIESLARGQYMWFLIEVGLIYLNYSFWKERQ